MNHYLKLFTLNFSTLLLTHYKLKEQTTIIPTKKWVSLFNDNDLYEYYWESKKNKLLKKGRILLQIVSQPVNSIILKYYNLN